MNIKFDEIHVFWREDIKHWCARSLVGDYGISEDREYAYNCAKDAFLSNGSYKKVVIHRQDGAVELTIIRASGEPSSQLFQDSVP